MNDLSKINIDYKTTRNTSNKPIFHTASLDDTLTKFSYEAKLLKNGQNELDDFIKNGGLENFKRIFIIIKKILKLSPLRLGVYLVNRHALKNVYIDALKLIQEVLEVLSIKLQNNKIRIVNNSWNYREVKKMISFGEYVAWYLQALDNMYTIEMLSSYYYSIVGKNSNVTSRFFNLFFRFPEKIIRKLFGMSYIAHRSESRFEKKFRLVTGRANKLLFKSLSNRINEEEILLNFKKHVQRLKVKNEIIQFTLEKPWRARRMLSRGFAIISVSIALVQQFIYKGDFIVLMEILFSGLAIVLVINWVPYFIKVGVDKFAYKNLKSINHSRKKIELYFTIKKKF
ncbi:MAG: hypothetical protein ACNFW9_05410 [Candidatus Kerfeldbacteria bacterium]